MTVTRGSRIRLEDEGEGWFPSYVGPNVAGTVASVLLDDTKREWYVVAFDDVLELQEAGAHTQSGLGLFRYPWALVRPRHVGESLGHQRGVSCFVSLVREGEQPPATTEDLHDVSVAVWARCFLLSRTAV
jgi:hypothetical protein